MNIVITNTFKKEFISIFKSESLMTGFCEKIKYSKNIRLDFPLDKIKFKYVWIDIRWIIFIWIKDKILPIFIIKKSNKKYWNNLVLNKEIKDISKIKLKNCLLDFENNDYKLY